MDTQLLFFYTESPLHAGTGSGLSVVDLPIQRERTTQFPNLQGSGVKGALRSQSNGTDDEVNAVFGPDTKGGSDYAGAAMFGEARIVLFPVRSLAGIFAYTTCPQVLARLFREAQRIGLVNGINLPDIADTQCLVTSQRAPIVANDKVVLEEFSFTATENPMVGDIAKWLTDNALPAGDEYAYWRSKLQTSLVILPDNAFRDFVVNSTEITTRVRIVPDSKTVQNGALWTQEALPADSLMFSTVVAQRLRVASYPPSFGKGTSQEVLEWLGQNIPLRLQMGGDETTGSGQVALRWL